MLRGRREAGWGIVSRTVDGAGVDIAFNSNRSDADGEEVRKDHNHADPLV